MDQDSSFPDDQKDPDETKAENAKANDLAAVFEEGKTRYDRSISALADTRRKYKEDIEFAVLGKQWDTGVQQWRKNRNRQSLTYNQLGPLIRNAANRIRRSTPSIKVRPESSGANKDTAQVLDGMVKRIQSVSHAKQVYSGAYATKIGGGLGFWRVIVKEVQKRSGPKVEIRLDRVKDPLTVVWDPHFDSIDGSDMEFLFFLLTISKSRFQREYKGKTATSFSQDVPCDNDSVVIAEYWRREPDGSVAQYILNGEEVIWASNTTAEDGTPLKYLGKHIPFVGVWGEDVHLDGTREDKSLHRDAKDVQKLINYTKSEVADRTAKSNKSQYLLDLRTIANPKIQSRWNNPNADNAFYLPYEHVDNVPAPQAITAPAPPMGDIEVGNQAVQDLRQMVGVASPVEDIPASQSGKAIQLQLDERDIQLTGFVDGLHVAIQLTGSIVVDLIQAYKVQPETVTVEGRDGQLSEVLINQAYTENDMSVHHQIGSGDYAVEIDIGPTYLDKRAEDREAMAELLKSPTMGEKVAAVGADIVVGVMDFDKSDVLEKRLRATIPPNILAASSPTNADKSQQQLQQLQQVGQQQHALIQDQHAQIAAAAEEIARLKAANDVKLQIAELNSETAKSIAEVKASVEILLKRMENAHDAAMVDHNPGAQLQVIT